MTNLTDLSGRTFGRLTAIRRTRVENKRGLRWICRCECGKEVAIRTILLLNENTSSCGCLRNTQGGYSKKKHPQWKRWIGMMERCHLPSHPHYGNYGGRGISVCERWHHFPNFIADMEPTYFSGASIERINNDGNYEPDNCRWATAKEQCRNTRRNVFIVHNGESRPISEWAELVGQNRKLVEQRIRKGWNPTLALTMPPLPRGVERSRGPRR